MKTLKIDARHLKSGIGTFTKNLLKEIHRIHNESDFNITLIGNKEILSKEFYKFSIQDDRSPIYSIREQIHLAKNSKNADLFHSSHYNIPLFYKGKLIVTVYDVAHLILDDSIKNPIKKAYANLFFNTIAKNADVVITISEFSKNEIIKYTKIPEYKIRVVYCGCDHLISHKKTTDELVKSREQPYILYVGNLRPHKNIHGLVNGFIRFKNKFKTEHKLILAGHPNIEYLKTIKPHKDIEYLFDMSNGKIAALYKNAKLFAFLSVYEGFGLPPFEALTYDVPVLLSDIAIFRETLGNCPFYCDPNSEEEIADKLFLGLNDLEKRSDCIIKGKLLFEKYSWERAGQKVYEIYKYIK